MLEPSLKKKEEINETSVIINEKLFWLIKGKFWNLMHLDKNYDFKYIQKEVGICSFYN